MADIAGRNVGTNDLVVMGAGVLMFVDSLLPWYGASYLGHSSGTSAWSVGIGAWFPVLLVIAVAGVAAARVFAGRALPPIAGGVVGWNFLAAAVSVLAVIIILLRWVTYPDAPNIPGFSAGAKFGTYLGLIIAAVQAVFGYLSVVAVGEKLPWQKSATA
jgi:hypothetical protein